MSQEVRHINKLKMFAHLLMTPYEEQYDKDDFDEAVFFKDFNEEHQDNDDNGHEDAGKGQATDILDIDWRKRLSDCVCIAMICSFAPGLISYRIRLSI